MSSALHPTRGLHWPCTGQLRDSLRVIGTSGLCFVCLYTTADCVAGALPWQCRVHLSWELEIPLVAEAIWGYVSLYPMVALAPFILRGRAAIFDLGARANLLTVVSAVAFIVIPARVGFPDQQTTMGPIVGWVFEYSERLNLDHNIFPSLHVGFAVLLARSYGRVGGSWFFVVWALAIAISTLLTHQHHLADVVAGAALAWFVANPDRITTPFFVGGRPSKKRRNTCPSSTPKAEEDFHE